RTLPAAVDTAGAVDINAAGLEELMSLPGIGEVRAQAILEDREKNGPYRYPEDLIRVRGIGEGILEHILDRITTGGDQDAEDFGG
ncbi:MAG: ComEA family DNA-binding protein, partial [Oscillospiraceae bacterium]|nr:ComEA family DNA-binding protein [Oscillospiraceae bacterium]